MPLNKETKPNQINHNALDKRGKIFCVTSYMETKSFKTVSKYVQPINMIIIYY